MAENFEPLRAIGLMSGTSRDGIDAAVLVTDGEAYIEPGPARTQVYDAAFRRRLADGCRRAAEAGFEARAALAELEAELTDCHIAAVGALLDESGLNPGDVVCIGFHGHTMVHRPEAGVSWQLGNAGRLARTLGIDVIADFRAADIAAGGQGAPLAPVYHRARVGLLDRAQPVAVLNIGGVSNVTWIDPSHRHEPDMLAFDCGPGNALLDDWAAKHLGAPYDAEGRLAAAGSVDDAVLAKLIAHPYFAMPPPKSLDRDAFWIDAAVALSAADGAATLAAFTVEAIAAARHHFPKPVKAWYVSGGGRHNPTLMAGLEGRMKAPVAPVESLGWRGDFLEAELFAYLAVRAIRGLPLSYPATSGVPQPMPGGRLFKPASGVLERSN